MSDVNELCVNAIRMLSVDAVDRAKSGHPGMPLGAAPMAYALWTKFLRHNPKDPGWLDRDRFILSAGHGSALLYALLHLTGYDLSIEEVRRFRQHGSRTPGHPEYGLVPGVEATTGPLGQGFAMGVGMAMAERFMAARYNRPGLEIVNHRTYAIVSDGDLMEGITSEAASLAGHLKLGKMVYLYDDNRISIEGSTDIAFTEDAMSRFDSYGWHTQRVGDGNDVEAISKAIERANAEGARPSIIAVRTSIGFGSPKQDHSSAHGEPLGEDANKATREYFKWEHGPFEVPAEVKECFDRAAKVGADAQAAWQELFARYGKGSAEDAARFAAEVAGELPKGWEDSLPKFGPDDMLATRQASGKVINALAPVLPNLIGGSADLGPSNQTLIADGGDVSAAEPKARNIRFGVREHAMGAIVNGMALHGGTIPYGATFFVFSDYMRPSVRLAALMGVHSIFVFTHDSVAVGEDGPTHQPIEHLASMRAIPDLTVIRPADANETAGAWRVAVERNGPVAFVLTRQKVPPLKSSASDVAKGAYVISDCEGKPEITIIGTGSEVQLAIEAQGRLKSEGVAARVVSMPSWELFAEQSQKYRDSVIPPDCARRVAVEAGATQGWHRWVGENGRVVGIDRFGMSAPGPVAMKELGITADAVVKAAKELLQ